MNKPYEDYELLADYEPCGDCGYDHAYEPEEAREWHLSHPCSYCEYSEEHGHEDNCPVKDIE